MKYPHFVFQRCWTLAFPRCPVKHGIQELKWETYLRPCQFCAVLFCAGLFEDAIQLADRVLQGEPLTHALQKAFGAMAVACVVDRSLPSTPGPATVVCVLSSQHIACPWGVELRPQIVPIDYKCVEYLLHAIFKHLPCTTSSLQLSGWANACAGRRILAVQPLGIALLR